MKITYCDPYTTARKVHTCPLCNGRAELYNDERTDKIIAFLMTLNIPGYKIDIKKDVPNENTMENQKELSHSGASTS